MVNGISKVIFAAALCVAASGRSFVLLPEQERQPPRSVMTMSASGRRLTQPCEMRRSQNRQRLYRPSTTINFDEDSSCTTIADSSVTEYNAHAADNVAVQPLGKSIQSSNYNRIAISLSGALAVAPRVSILRAGVAGAQARENMTCGGRAAGSGTWDCQDLGLCKAKAPAWKSFGRELDGPPGYGTCVSKKMSIENEMTVDFNRRRIIVEGSYRYLGMAREHSGETQRIPLKLSSLRSWFVGDRIVEWANQAMSASRRLASTENNSQKFDETKDVIARLESLHDVTDDRGGRMTSGTCFPGDATVQDSNGTTIRMDELQVGTTVHISMSTHAMVYFFSHAENKTTIEHDFLTFNTIAGYSVTMTPSHYVYVNGRELVAARTVRLGDSLTVARTGQRVPISSIVPSRRRSLYAPHTMHELGDIAVDGILVSTYTAAVRPDLAHKMLLPLRLFFQRFACGHRPACRTLLRSMRGISMLSAWVPGGNDYIGTLDMS
jgi:Hint module